MTKRWRTFFAWSGFALVLGCKSSKPQPSDPAPEVSAQPSHSVSVPAPFVTGSPAEALKLAKDLQKPVFLYWGAVWCPPCNELKARIFSAPGFAEWMKSFVPVYLDGDGEEAQIWAEQLQITAYPTLLILSSDGQEQMRLQTTLSLDEFGEALTLYWSSSKNASFESALRSLESESQSSPEALRLFASLDFAVLPPHRFAPERLRSLLEIAWERSKQAGLSKEEAVFAAALLEASVMEPASSLKAKAPALFHSILLNADTAWAARVFVCTWTKPALEWRFGSERGEAFSALKKQWLKAADSIAAHPKANAEIQLLSLGPGLEFAEQEGALSDALRTQWIERIQSLLARHQASPERHALLGHAAFFLKRLGDAERARTLLIEDANTSKTPWYSYSSLASLEEQLGRMDEALAWSEKARNTAQGRASKLQWMANDFALHAKVNPDKNKKYLIELLRDYYTLALGLGDGFAGRNRSRAGQIKTALKSLPGDQRDIQQLRQRFQLQCQKLQGENKNNCEDHFRNSPD